LAGGWLYFFFVTISKFALSVPLGGTSNSFV